MPRGIVTGQQTGNTKQQMKWQENVALSSANYCLLQQSSELLTCNYTLL